MKHFLLVASLACSLAGARAQGTIEFKVSLNGANEVPPNGSPGFGSGTWTLRGSSLDYVVTTSVLFQGGAQATDMTLNGPAGAGSTAPILFDLGVPTLIPIQPPPGAYYSWNDTVNNLTSGQIGDLLAGLWYVNVFTSSGDFPGGEIHGQIIQVPEPSVLALLAVAGAVCSVARWRKGRCSL